MLPLIASLLLIYEDIGKDYKSLLYKFYRVGVMKPGTLLALPLGLGLALLIVGLTIWSTRLIAVGSGILVLGVVSYVAIRSELELKKVSSRFETNFYENVLRLMLEEFELYDENTIYFLPSSLGGESSILISHKNIDPPIDLKTIPKRLFFEHNGVFYIRFPSIISMLSAYTVSRTNNVSEVESQLDSFLKDLGLISSIKIVEKPDGTLIVDTVPSKDVVINDVPTNSFLNLTGSIISDSLNSILQFIKVERNGDIYRIYFRMI